jgi:transaldolase
MKLFIDTANVNEIKRAADMGVICGVTTNPSLIAKEGRDFAEVIKEIAGIVDGPISAEVIALEAALMVDEALAFINKMPEYKEKIVIKLPFCEEGLVACRMLTEKGIKTNVTLIYSAAQAVLAANAGAAFVSPFVGRLDDVGTDGLALIEEVMDIFQMQEIETEVIAASIRNPIHVTKAARMGCDIATVPFNVIIQMLTHPLTAIGIERFLKDWEDYSTK